MAFVQDSLGNGEREDCSGTVVAVNLILTAGHCAGNESTGAANAPGGYLVATGRLDISDASSGQVISVKRVILYPGWDPSTHDGDVALLQLTSATAAPALTLAADPGDLSLLDAGTGALIAGWGRTDPYSESTPAQLQYAQTVVQSPDYCSQQAADANGSFDSSDQVCAIDAPSDSTGTCNGDSGGPLLAQRSDGTWIEIGVTSWGPVPAGTDECQTDRPDFFTRADAISSWVASWAAAVAPPTASTRAATQVDVRSAVLNGRMNPDGFASTDYFEYGTTRSYGSVTPAQTTNNGDTPINISATVRGLRPSTTYYFRLVATTANGTTYGADQTLTTSHPYPEWGTYRGTTSQRQRITLRIPSVDTKVKAISFGFGLSCTRHSRLFYTIADHTPLPLDTHDGLGFDQVFFDEQGTRYHVEGLFTTTGMASGTIDISWRTRRYGTCRSGTIDWHAS